MISLSQLSKRYRTEAIETTALDSIDLQIERGEFVAVTGPSGCGKSTLLNIVAMIDAPSSGVYRFGDDEVSKYPESRLVELRQRHIGFIFQNFNLIEELTVFENIELPLLYRGIPRNERQSRVREVLELVGLQHRARNRPPQLSGGQQQRVAVARAVVVNPSLIVADEPTGNLDTQNGKEVMQMFTRLNAQGATILMVTHSPEHAARAQRIVSFLDGRLVKDSATPLRT